MDTSFYILARVFIKAGLVNERKLNAKLEDKREEERVHWEAYRQLRIMLWRYYNKMSIRQCAELEGITSTAIAGYEQRALKKLRELGRDKLLLFL